MQTQTKTCNRVLSFLLALVMMFSLMPVFEQHAHAAGTLSLGVNGLTASWTDASSSKGSASWSGNGNTVEGVAVGYKQGLSTKNITTTLVLTNNRSETALLSFDYTLTGGESTTNIIGVVNNNYPSVIASAGTMSDGKFSYEIDSGKSVTITLTSPKGAGLSGNLSITNLSLVVNSTVSSTFLPADVGGSYTVTPAGGTAQTINESTKLTQDSTAAYALTATPAYGYNFLGWYSATVGSYLSYEASVSLKFESDPQLKPVFVSTSVALFGVGSAKFDSLQAAGEYATSSGGTRINLLNSGSLSGNHTIPAGVTLLVPFDDVYTCYTSVPGDTGGNFVGVGDYGAYESINAWETPYAFRKLTLADGATITVNGAISVSAKHSPGNTAGQETSGSPSGACGFIQMNSGSKITLESGANLYAWGYITGEGKVIAKSGANVYENIQFTDFRGGTATSAMATEYMAFPMSQYYVQNIEVPTTYYAGSSEYVYCSIYMSRNIFGASVKFMGTGGMFSVSDGYITKDYIESTDRLKITTNGNGALNGMTMELGGTAINSSVFVLPINSNIDISINSGTTTVNQSLAMLPGSNLTVAQGAELVLAQTNVTEGEGLGTLYTGAQNLIIFDADNWKWGLDSESMEQVDGYFVHSGKRLRPVKYSAANGTTVKRTESSLVDVVFDINGTVTTNGYLYTTTSADWSKGGASIISSGGTGKLVMASGAGQDVMNVQANYDGSVVYLAVPMMPAALKNADEKYTFTGTVDRDTLEVTGAAPGQEYSIHEGNWVTYYKVEWMDAADKVIETDEKVMMDTTPEFNGTLPTQAPTKDTVYTFDYWVDQNDAQNSVVTSDMVYRPVFKTETRTYTVNYLDAAGKTIETDTLAYGAALDFNGTAPTKDSDAAKHYTFSAWEFSWDAITDESVASGVINVKPIFTEAAHTETAIREAVPATCTTDGATAGTKCSVCSYVIKAVETIPATGHPADKVTVIAYKAPTCTDAGNEAGKYCAECETYYDGYQEIDANGHTETKIPAVASTCTTYGTTEGTKCSVCDFVIKAPEEVALKPHTEQTVPGKDATCTTTGLTDGKKCSVCEQTLEEQKEIPTKAHTEEVIPGKAATCTETGLTDGKKCSKCGTVTVEQTTIPTIAHTEEKLDAVAATCTTTGLTEGSKCSVCKNILTAQETIDALGHTEETVPGKAATCKETGLTEGSKCSVCKETLVAQKVVEKLAHTEQVLAEVPATCTSTGLEEGSKCSVCGEILVAQKEVPALGHAWDEGKVTTAPTCEGAGVKTFTCGTCKTTYTEAVDATGHTSVDVAAIPVKCLENGQTAGTKCSVCQAVLSGCEVITAPGHTAQEIPAVPATCTTDGKTVGEKCSVCDEVTTEPTKISALGHTFSEKQNTVAPTCTEGGYTTYKCVRCTKTENRDSTNPKGHTPEVLAEVKPTCTTIGKTEGKKCSECGYILVAQQDVAATGHTETEIPAVASTCTTHGTTAGTKCSVCDFVIKAPEEAALKPHNQNVSVPGKAATCTETGLTEGKKCSVCGQTQVVQETIKALGHTPKTVAAVAPTCTTTGLEEGSKCSVCDFVIKAQETVAELGHDYTKFVETVAPTCTTDGYDLYKCSRCDATEQQNIVKASHTPEVLAAVAPTCTKTGLTEGSKCSVCQDTLVAQKVVEMLAHTPEKLAAVAPDCLTDGLTEGSKCSICGQTQVAQEVDPALGHDFSEKGETTAPTCEEYGYTTYKCSRCDETTKMERVNALGHIEKIVPGKDATCTENGLTEGKVCERETCGKTLVAQQVTNLVDHTIVDVKGKDATCTEPGLTDGRKCSVADCVYVEKAQDVIAAKGHDYSVFVETIAPTCLTDGYTTYKCSRCGLTENRDEISATGHNHVVTAVAPTAAWVAAKNVYTCVCGDTYEEKPAAGLFYVGDDTYYLDDDAKAVTGLVRHVLESGEVNYYYFMEDTLKAFKPYADDNGKLVNLVALNKTNGLNLPAGQSFPVDENGVLIHVEDTSKNGWVKEDNGLTYNYVDGITVYLGLVEKDGSYYYINSKGVVVMGKRYYVSRTNGLLKADTYTFDAEGKLLLLNGILEEGGKLYFYENSKRVYKGLIEIDGDYYYVRSNGQVVTKAKYWVTKHNDLMAEGAYEFGEDGKMIIPDVVPDVEPEVLNGIVKEGDNLYFYENNKRVYKGLIELDGEFYYVRSSGELVVDRSYWVTKNNNLMPVGSYTFGADGKMVK